MINKGIPVYLLACTTLFSCQSTKSNNGQEIVLKNTASTSLTDKAIAIKRDNFADTAAQGLYPVLLTQKGDTIASQLDDLDGDQQWDELFFVIDLPANGEQVLNLTWVGTQPQYTQRTNIRFGKRSAKDKPVQPKTNDTIHANQLPKSIGYQPYQTDGPTWENDKVAFRHYLDGRNAKDLFGKKVSYMSPEDVGINAAGAVEDNYHVMHEWGRDIMAVGNSVGIGGVALMIGDSFPRLGVTANDSINNVGNTAFNIVTEGPVRSKTRIVYNNWQPEGTSRSYTLEEQPTIWPGMYAYQNTVKVTSGLQGDETLLIGMNNLDTTSTLEEIPVDDEWMILLTHDRETYNKEWILGLALIIPKSSYLGYTEAPASGKLAQASFAKLKVEGNKPISYYAVGGWEQSDEGFKDAAYFRSYVKSLAKQISAKVNVQVRQ
ncbi:DUF4861 domain-containing protein [Pontibacter silvestris]|uniref:DUF4861 domain-containing protein n=1 Tax=Pontibacter silvestris TaxID=2305183 RepID=A0ABW4X004_9BACT|nr:DUF4861 domain-containing protein [Pontibacter silvestris]MCC9135564.1 DUF4861 domain-containing protein [Pontibacter silvestris]